MTDKKYYIPGVYIITNIANHRIYIGGSKNSNIRKSQHYHMLRRNKHHNKRLQLDWNIYGEQNFEFEIIMTCEANIVHKIENELVARLADDDYNVRTVDGYGKRENKGGVKHNLKSVIQYSINNEYIRDFKCIADANRSLYKNPNDTCIGGVCKNKRKTAFGFKWKYVEINKGI
jgi:hypothetical protein